MRIKSLELAWFRGAAEPVSLDTNCKSIVVYGDNGSGKSSFVDAVEYVLNNGSLRHLRNEYSGTHQEKGIPNTHRPAGSRTTLRFKFKDNNELSIDFEPNGTSKRSGTDKIDMPNWEYKQTVLRQDEVSRFIHDTKGDKYSALLPLFGLEQMETTAENLRQLAKSVETESKPNEKKVKLKQIDEQQKDAFGTKGEEEISKEIVDLFAQYCKGVPTTSDTLSHGGEIELAIDNELKGYTADNQRYFFLRQVAEAQLEAHIDSVRASSVDLTESMESNIVVKLAVLQSARTFGDALGGIDEIDCPACGQVIAAGAFRDHVKAESERLRKLEDIYVKYKAAIGSVCSSLDSLKSNLEKSELKTWRDELKDAVAVDGLKYLCELDIDALREACTDNSLKAIEVKVLPIVAGAEIDSKDTPQSVQQFMDDKKRSSAAVGVVASRDLQSELDNCNTLVELLTSLEKEVRSEIRRQSQMVIDSISKDIGSMWATLHPGEKIENVRLSVPQDQDKAIDVILKFYGKDQDSPRLTLSEGYRNSLGLCIFLAMAKQVVDKERPLFLDDVVVSLDRDHRGMIRRLLEEEFSDRQVIIFTHDKEWYTELRYQLGNNNNWIFKRLLPYDTPDTGIRWSHKTTTFDDARSLISERPEAAGNDARRIMDVELPIIAESLKIRLPYLRSDGNDRRVAHDFLVRLVADGKRCFQKKSGTEYIENTDAIDVWAEADKLLMSWGNRSSHTFDIVPSEVEELLDACEKAIASVWCETCSPTRNVWFLESKSSEWVQCQCGELRWRYRNS